jgi:predicted transcriptional regulator
LADPKGLKQALAQLGPLEARIMRAVWTGAVREPFVVRDVNAQMTELAYTTVMTTVNRLADKGLLHADASKQGRAIAYRSAGDPHTYLAAASRHQVDQMVEELGDAALAAFAARLESLSPERRRRLKELAGE